MEMWRRKKKVERIRWARERFVKGVDYFYDYYGVRHIKCKRLGRRYYGGIHVRQATLYFKKIHYGT